MAEGTIVEVAAGNPDFSTLVAAVKAAGLTETLSAEGPYTVFRTDQRGVRGAAGRERWRNC